MTEDGKELSPNCRKREVSTSSCKHGWRLTGNVQKLTPSCKLLAEDILKFALSSIIWNILLEMVSHWLHVINNIKHWIKVIT